MPESPVIFRLNLIIVLLFSILLILLWPLLPTIFLYVIVALFFVTGAAILWALT